MRLGSIGHVSSDAALRLVSTIGGVFAFNAAFDDQGVRVCELNVDVLLINPRQFTLELVGVFVFTDVELRLEGADR